MDRTLEIKAYFKRYDHFSLHRLLILTNKKFCFKVKKGRGTRVALTASHSSIIVEECVQLLRALHNLQDWTLKINESACLKLSLVHEIVAEIPTLPIQDKEHEDFLAQQSSIMASLALIGGLDSRPRLGGLVRTENGSKGTVCKIDSQGKLHVQVRHDFDRQ